MAVWYRARAELRGSWRGVAAVALLVALLGGTVLTAVAGARRTASAYPRMREATEAVDVLAGPLGEPADPDAFRLALGRLAGVVDASEIIGVPLVPLAGSPTARLAEEAGGESLDVGIPLSSTDGRWGYEFGRPIVRDGRLPDPDATDEVLISAILAKRTGVGVGDTYDVVISGNDDLAFQVDATADQGVVLHLTVTGVGIFANEVVPVSDLDGLGAMFLPPAIADLVEREGLEPFFSANILRVAPGVDVGGLADPIKALADDPEAGEPGPLLVTDEQANSEEVQDSIAPLASALAAFAAVVAVIGLLVVGQAVARHTRVPPGEVAALTALGASRRDRVLVTVVRASVVAVAGALGAAVLAASVSSRFPIGPARLAEPDPGFDLDGAVLGLGVVAIVVLVVLSALPGAVLGYRPSRARSRISAAASSAVAGLGFRPPAVQGARFALDGANRSAPVRSTLVASVAAAGFVLAAATFATSLTVLVDTPSRYGQGWDALADGDFSPIAIHKVLERLDPITEVSGLAAGSYIELETGGRSVPAVSMVTLRGDAGLTVLDGERADEAGEVAFGRETLAELGASIGDTVTADLGAGPVPLRVVGTVLFPRMNRGSFNGTGLGIGAQVHPDSAPAGETLEPGDELPPGLTMRDFDLDGQVFNFLGIAIDGDPAPIDAVLSDALAAFEVQEVLRDSRPTAIADLDRVRAIPLALAMVLAVAAAALLAHLLVSSVAARRRDLALLRTLGFRGTEVRAAVAWQATLVASVATVVGIPLGVAVGRTLWRSFADGIGAPSAPAMPWPWVALSVPVALLLANAVAALPARRAARLSPAAILRGER